MHVEGIMLHSCTESQVGNKIPPPPHMQLDFMLNVNLIFAREEG